MYTVTINPLFYKIYTTDINDFLCSHLETDLLVAVSKRGQKGDVFLYMEHLTSINRQITAVISYEDTDAQTSVDSEGFVWLQYGNSDVLIVWSVIQHVRFAHTAKCQSLTHIQMEIL